MSEINRRKFMGGASGMAVAAVGASMIGRKGWAAANDRIRIACMGINGRGGAHINGFSSLENVEVATLCDPDMNVLERRARELESKTGKRPKIVQDMREVFDDKEIDCVSIATPNHWHALASIWAMQAGKDVYCEKPGSHNIFEGRQVARAQKKYGRVVQMGPQSRSSVALRDGVQKLSEGIIGEVYMARGICFKWRDTIGKVDGPQPIPEGVDYDLWCGPSPKVPLMRKRLHYDWHWQWAQGNGDIGNQGIHEMDRCRWGLGVGLPTHVNAEGGHFMFDDDQQTPNVLVATYRYPEQKKILVFEVRHWMVDHEAGIGSGGGNSVGNIFYGSEGYMVMPSYSGYRVYLGKNREPQEPVNEGGNHFANFIDAVRAADPSQVHAPPDDIRKSAALCHLANISYRLGRSLDFDPESERFKSDNEADRMLTREYRKPFVVPEKV